MEIQDQELKKMQSIQLEMADVLLDFCKRHELTIWAGYGTLLGTVRHQGFIPWDDDMDFVMLRKDFDKLRRLTATESLPCPLAFDTSRVDVIKVKNCNTTQVATLRITEKENFGIWIDIWCLDSFPEEGIPDKVYSDIHTLSRVIANATQVSYFRKGILRILYHMWYHTYCLVYAGIVGKTRLFNTIETKIKKLNGEGQKGELYANLLFHSKLKKNSSFSHLKKYHHSWFDETCMLSFEGRDFPCPARYIEVLTVEYGDYMKPVKGTSVHDTIILDMNRPYKEVVHEFLQKLPWYKRFLYKI